MTPETREEPGRAARDRQGASPTVGRDRRIASTAPTDPARRRTLDV
ncbi:hypothetical protein OG741_17250 [Streptomyces sp. NBC_01410]